MVLMAVIVKCSFCKWSLVAKEVTKQAKEVVEGHLRWHTQQGIADLESMLEDEAREEEEE